MKLIDLSGQRFGRLRVVSRHFENTKLNRARWNCVCDCGETVIVNGNSLSAGRTKSCGCLKIEMQTTHGYSHLAEFQIWRQMKERCYNTKAPNYENYGARGIVVCDEWKESFETFYKDMGPRPSPEHSIDRKDNDKSYSKVNCRWATQIEQLNNKRNNRVYEYNGESKTLMEWCRALNLKYQVIEQRIRVSKMSFERAITFIPPTTDTLITIDGVTKTLITWCRERLIKFPMVINRLFRGWTLEEALQPIASLSISYSTSGKEEDIETKTLEQWCCLLDLDKNQIYLRVLRGEIFEDIVKEL